MGRWFKRYRQEFSDFSLCLEETKSWFEIKDKFFYFVRMKYMNKGKPYCVRCSSVIGQGHAEDNLYNWNGFWICKWCYDQKISGIRNGVDLEDLDEYRTDKIKTDSRLIKQKLDNVN